MIGNKLKCLLISHLVLQNIKITHQFKNGVQGFRKRNDFGYDFKDWDDNGTQYNLFDYNIGLENIENYETTPVIYVTIPTTKETTTTKATTFYQGIHPSIYDIPQFTASTDSTTNVEGASVSKPTFGISLLAFGVSTINTDVTSVTDVATVPSETVPKPMEDSNITPSMQEPVTETTTELIMTFPETPTTESQWTTLPAHMTTYAIHYPSGMTFPDFGPTRPQPPPLPMQEATTYTVPTTTESAISREFHLDMEQIHGGYFTTFLFELFKIIPQKDHDVAQVLFRELEREIFDLELAGQFAGFGKSTIAALNTMVQSLNSVPADVIQSQSSVGKFLMLDRDSLGAEIASLMADVDTLYQPDEGRRVIKLIEDLSEFPNTPKTPKEIVHEMMDAVILAPFKRMYGTTKEKLIVKQLDELVIRLFFSGYPVPRRRYSGKQTTEQTRKKKNITTWNQRTKKIKTLPTPLTKLTTTKLTTIPNKYAAFSKNETIKKAFKYRLNRYRMKRDPNRWRQWRSKHTTTTTTTEKPTRVTRKVKSKYVIKRYVLKKMKKRKVKIFQNETGTFELVDFEDDLDGVEKTPIKEKYFQKTLNKNGVSTKGSYRLNRTKYFFKTTPKNIALVTKDRSNNLVLFLFTKDENNQFVKKVKEIGKNNKDLRYGKTKKPSNRYVKNTVSIKDQIWKNNEKRRRYSDISRRFTILQRNNVDKNQELRTFFPKEDNIVEDSSVTDEEKLKANLDDALFHEKPIRNSDFRNFGRRKIESSYSDDETVLKSRIYKVFGYEDDFAEALRQGKNRRQFV